MWQDLVAQPLELVESVLGLTGPALYCVDGKLAHLNDTLDHAALGGGAASDERVEQLALAPHECVGQMIPHQIVAEPGVDALAGRLERTRRELDPVDKALDYIPRGRSGLHVREELRYENPRHASQMLENAVRGPKVPSLFCTLAKRLE